MMNFYPGLKLYLDQLIQPHQLLLTVPVLIS